MLLILSKKTPGSMPGHPRNPKMNNCFLCKLLGYIVSLGYVPRGMLEKSWLHGRCRCFTMLDGPQGSWEGLH